MDDSAVRVDIVSDVVCPWCIIGYGQLKAAADALTMSLDVHWHPYELNPHMPSEGQKLTEHIFEKYGIEADVSAKTRQVITELGAENGFEFNYHSETRIVNTMQAHKLVKWASRFNKRHELKMTLFRRYFTDCQNISKSEILLEAVEEVSLNTSEAFGVINNEELSRDIRAEEQLWKSKGVRVVPTLYFGGSKQVTGAPGIHSFMNIMRMHRDEPSG